MLTEKARLTLENLVELLVELIRLLLPRETTVAYQPLHSFSALLAQDELRERLDERLLCRAVVADGVEELLDGIGWLLLVLLYADTKTFASRASLAAQAISIYLALRRVGALR